MGLITLELMHQLTGLADSSFDVVFCDDFNSMIAVTAFEQDLNAFRMLMAQCMHTTCNFETMYELGGAAYFPEMYEGRSDLQIAPLVMDPNARVAARFNDHYLLR